MEKHNTGKMPSGIDLKYINQKLKDCPDIIRRKVYTDNGQEAFFFSLEDTE